MSLSEIIGPLPIAPQDNNSPLHAALADGTAQLSGNQEVSFTPYCRVILPVDGWVFWLNANLLTPQQLSQHGLQTADPIQVQGSLHYASAGVQEEDQSIVVRKVDFSAMAPIPALAAIAPTVLYVASWDVSPIGSFRFTFSSRGLFYQQANEYHYSGDAVYPVFDQMLIDSVDQFSQRPVVSNSLPIWLQLFGGYSVPFPAPITSDIQVFPAWLVPANQPAPYAAVEIPPAGSSMLALAPHFHSAFLSQDNLIREHVRFTLYGLRNDQALDFQAYLYWCAELNDMFGLMEPAHVVDEHRPQVELTVLAQKKTVEMTVSYYQRRARDVARQLIKDVVVNYVPNLYPPVPRAA